ncbi:polysaccharide biosynthesis tyrosine autokinase [Marinifilum fragile]|uniref:GumC family protein n=1 Tax=Marinifilum fragile TaxID=570161 RepID=UPI002AA71DA7|nr:polysaccharide biosynthesis tyrosine autokinase [Marinifilum fragile]
MMQSNSVQDISVNEDEIDLKELFFRLLSKWHWFVVFGFLGIVLGFLFSRVSQPVYDAKSVILVDENKKGMGVENLFEGMELGNGPNMQNHVGILNSYTLNLQALNNLNWRTTFYKKNFMKKTDLYKTSPFKISENGGENLTGVELLITPLEGNHYSIRVDDKFVDGNVEYDVAFEATGEFGVPFKNQYFDFTLEKIADLHAEEYSFYFNNLEVLALDYVEKVGVNLVDKNSELIQLGLQGSNSQRIVDYLNELSDVYLQFGLKKKNQISLNTVMFIDNQLDGIVDSLKTAGQEFSDFRSKNKSIDLSHEAELVLDKVAEIEKEQSEIDFRIDYFRNLLNYMGNAKQMEKVAAPSFVGIADAGLNTQVVKLAELYGEQTKLSFVAKDKNPTLIILNKEINNVIKSLEENVRNLLTHAETEARTLKKRKDNITIRLAGLPETEQEMINIKRRFDLNNEIYTFLLKKRAEASIQTASNISDVQIIDPARVRTVKKIGPKTMLLMVIGGFFGGLLPLIIILLKDFFNDSVKSKEDLEKGTTLPIMGEIARNNYKQEMAIVSHPRSGLAESYRGLRTNLQYKFKGDLKKVIGVHSMIPGEGKTFTASNLATIIAMDNKKVLLVACDLRKPRLHDVFGVPNGAGLSTYLIGQSSFKEILNQTQLECLQFVNSGAIPPNPAELLGGKEFEEFLTEAKNQYDYIVLDNAPVTLVTDGVLTSKFADSNLFVLRQGYSKQNQIKFINQLSKKGDMNEVGIVLNDTVHKGYGNSYGSYGYGNGYYDEDHSPRSFKEKLLGTFSRN